MISRRDFLKVASLGSTFGTTGCAKLRKMASARGKPYRLRTITYNVYVCQGWSRKKGPKPPRSEIYRMFAEALGKFQPDIITFQESPAEKVVETIAGYLEMNHTFFPSGQAWPGAVITRFEIAESRNCPIVGGKRPKDLFTRHWGRAVLATPFGELVLHSAHLHPSKNEVRMREVPEMVKAMEADFASGRPVILQGDLNHPPTRPEYDLWKKSGLVDAFTVAGEGPEMTIPADKPKTRIDYIWAYDPIAKHVRQVRVLSERPFRTDPNDPKSMALSDHLPVMATFA